MQRYSLIEEGVNPAYVGPGIWYFLHAISYRAHTPESQADAVSLIRLACERFPCRNCREHATLYLDQHPPELSIGITYNINGITMELGVFNWLWTFHNAVNARLAKPVLDWLSAYNLYGPPDALMTE
jgi:hypothetical protein